MTCEERSGFLFAHACEEPAVWPCALCGKNVCMLHTRVTDAGNTCITCARAQMPASERKDGTRTTDDPFFYSDDDYTDSSYYDAEDYDAFDASAGSEGPEDEGPEGDVTGS